MKVQPSTFNLKPSTNERPSTCRIGVLGAGNFATAVLLPVLHRMDDVELIGVASASGVSAAHAQRRFGFRYAASEDAQIFTDPSINTIAILTRHHLHAPQTLQALEAGKNVFCEKPLAITGEALAEIREGLSAQAAQSVLLMVGFNRRFAPLARKLREFFEGRQEPLAAHYRVNAGYIPPGHWVHDPAQGGGRILGEACHFIDFLTFLTGASPVSVEARGLPESGRYCEDNAVMTFEFPDGSIGTVSYLANGDKAFSKERVEVFAGGRAAVLDDFRMLEMVRDGRREVIRSRLRQDKGHAEEWRAFVAAIRSGGPPPIPYDHLFGVTAATLSALQALRQGGRVAIPRVW